ncbi:PREDICTED: melanoregulin-like [Nanorana parkeri]|uniref:melanoregulin-like n=1 Tax=Nanorana parkeri TaxID=125878 RepID=UPI000854E4C2|nr:PREDICTED: melanoregulin-like [Nanorana parkeri]
MPRNTMAERRTFYRLFCCCCNEDLPEKSPLISDTLLYFDREVKRRRAEEANLWNEPQDVSHTERDDDRELYNLLQKRARTRRGSEGYRRLSFDITAHRQVRKGVKDRWRVLLEDLGFHNEADSLLTVTSNTSYNSLRDPTEARRLLSLLAQETSIFDEQTIPPERYLFVLDRLIVLDMGTEFVSIARRFYPAESLTNSEIEIVEPGTAVLVSPGLQGTEDGGEKDEECAEMDEDSFLVNLLD